MNTGFPYSSARNNDGAASRPLDDAIPSRRAPAGLDRACCCPAMPMVRVAMPPTADRASETDLLLCGHHYRVSRQGLAAAGARVRGLPGTPGDTAAWVRLECRAAAAQVG
jgi:hypothetical protein